MPDSGGELTDGDAQNLTRKDLVNDPPYVGEEMNFDAREEDPSHRWIVLYPEDYENHMIDADGNVAIKVDIDQAGEMLRLASASIASLSNRDADADQVLRDLIKELRHQLKEHRRAQDGDGDE